MRASVSGTGAERKARCLRENVRVRSAPFALATIFNMRHASHSLLCKKIGPAPCCWEEKDMCPKPERQSGLGSNTAQDDELRWLRTTLLHSSERRKVRGYSMGRHVLGILCVVFTAVPGWAATLESPANGAVLSGLGFISGWKCDAGQITVTINGGGHIPVAMAQPRGDIRHIYGTLHHGFITQWNWALLGDGVHTLTAYDDGIEFAHATFTVRTTGEEFLKGASGQCYAIDFPSPGEHALLEWEESTQHFEIVEISDDLATLGVPPQPPAPEEEENPGASRQDRLTAMIGTWQVQMSALAEVHEVTFTHLEGDDPNLAFGTVLIGTVAPTQDRVELFWIPEYEDPPYHVHWETEEHCYGAFLGFVSPDVFRGAGARSVRFEVHHSDSHTPSPIWTCIPEAVDDATEQIESIHHETPVLMKRLTN